MKKFILVALAALFVCSAVDAQILRADELEKYAKEKYGEKWVDAATNALSPILVTLSGITISVKEQQPQNALLHIILTPSLIE